MDWHNLMNTIYICSTYQYIKGLPTVTMSAIDDISTITNTPVIVAQSVTYPPTISALGTVLTDAVLSTAGAFPTGAVVETVTYDDGTNNFTWPVNFTGFNGVQTDFYLSDILGTPAYPLNGHAGLTVDWTFTISGFAAPYSGTVTITPIAYITKGVCESTIGTAESFVLTYADAALLITETDITVCDPDALLFSADITYPTISNLNTSIKADCQLTSDVDFPAGTVIQWSYNSSPLQTYTLLSASSSILLSEITGISPVPSLQGHTGTDYWDFEITDAGAPSVHNLTIEPVAVLDATLYPYESEIVVLTVNDLPDPPTAGDVNVTYDGLLHTGTATAPGGSSVVWYDAETGGNVTVAPSGTDVGTYTAWAESVDNGTACYSDTRTLVTVTITMAPLTITANDDTKVYDGLAYSGGNGVVYDGFVNGETSAVLGGTLAYVGTSQGAIDFGTYVITPEGLTSGNYDITFVNGSLSITLAPLTITANDDTKVYDGLAYSGGNGVVYDGFVNGETSAVLGGTLTYGGTSQGAINTGAYAITPGGLTSTNYVHHLCRW